MTTKLVFNVSVIIPKNYIFNGFGWSIFYLKILFTVPTYQFLYCKCRLKAYFLTALGILS